MKKKAAIIIIIIMTAMLITAGCTKQTPSASPLADTDYKSRIVEYEAAKNKKKPTASLWGNVGSYGVNFIDYQSRNVGDIITIKIQESAQASNSNKTSTAKTTKYDASVTNILGLPTNLGVNNFMGSGKGFDPSISAGTNNSFQGNGKKDKNDSLNATISAVVVEILPSGNMIIEGHREIIVDQEKQTITIKGVIRPTDIDSNNSISSSAIADAQITYSGDGVISDANRKGWLATFIDWIWPF